MSASICLNYGQKKRALVMMALKANCRACHVRARLNSSRTRHAVSARTYRWLGCRGVFYKRLQFVQVVVDTFASTPFNHRLLNLQHLIERFTSNRYPYIFWNNLDISSCPLVVHHIACMYAICGDCSVARGSIDFAFVYICIANHASRYEF